MQDDADEDEVIQALNLVDHFIALLLAVFLEAGLLEVRFNAVIGTIDVTETRRVVPCVAHRGEEQCSEQESDSASRGDPTDGQPDPAYAVCCAVTGTAE